jgi:dihydrofolate synthase/folylpolyglutamate synthase
LDGCHNPEGAEALARFLAETGRVGRCAIVFGAMSDKDIEAIAARLLPLAGSVLLAPASSPRAAGAEELSRRVASARPDAEACPDVEQALRRALERSGGDPIIVAGSLYLVGEARVWLLSQKDSA